MAQDLFKEYWVFWLCWECVWNYFFVLWLLDCVKAQHCHSILPEEFLSKYILSVQSFLHCQRDRCKSSQPAEWALQSEIQLEFFQLEQFPLPVKCCSCGVYICLCSHFTWDNVIVPHAGSVYLFTYETPAPLWYCLLDLFINRKNKSIKDSMEGKTRSCVQSNI